MPRRFWLPSPQFPCRGVSGGSGTGSGTCLPAEVRKFAFVRDYACEIAYNY